MAHNLPQATNEELMEKFDVVLAQVQQEIVAVKSQYALAPGPHLTADDWAVVEQEARSYIWAWLCTHELNGPSLVPGTVLEIAMWRWQELQAAGGATALMEKFNRVFGAFTTAVDEIQMADPTLPVEQVIAKAERRAALQHPLDAPIKWFGKTSQVN